MRVVVTGATGLVGTAVCRSLVGSGDRVVAVSRDVPRAASVLPGGVEAVPWRDDRGNGQALEGADAILNLAGEPIAQRWTPAVKARLLESRVGTLDRLHRAMREARRPPGTLVSASAIGYYGSRGDESLTEESAPGTGFLPGVCTAWEDAARRFEADGTRTVRVRVGVVLAREGGALARMLPLFRLGVGGPVGSGRQWMSWIHLDDLVELLRFALREQAVTGALNGTAPEPVTNARFAAELGRAVRRPALVPAPAPALRAAFGEMATMVLEGQKVLPEGAGALGFRFRHPSIGGALDRILS
jgi:uncharacterized protein (TIGR01777 family)